MLALSLARLSVARPKNSAVVSFRTLGYAAVAPCFLRQHTFSMKPLVGVLVTVAFLFGIYIIYLKKMPSTDQGTASTQAISLTGVRMDLLQIAKAERNSIGVDGHCLSLSELLSSGSMSMSRPERDGYVYSVDCSGNNFTATARHDPAPPGSPIRYPNLAIDQTMEVHEVE